MMTATSSSFLMRNGCSVEIPEKVHWMLVYEGGDRYSVSAPGYRYDDSHFRDGNVYSGGAERVIIEKMVEGSIAECCDYIRSIVEFDIDIDRLEE